MELAPRPPPEAAMGEACVVDIAGETPNPDRPVSE